VCPLALNYIFGPARAYDLEFRISMRRFLPSGLLLLATTILVSTMTYQDAFSLDRVQARSMVISQSGIVASESPLASQAGAAVLARGGNAVDAAITAHAVMTVVAPMWNGIGGDLFAIVYDAKSGKMHVLNASGRSAYAATPDAFKARNLTAVPSTGVLSVSVREEEVYLDKDQSPQMRTIELDREYARIEGARFNLMQLALATAALIAVLILFDAIRTGLLGTPQMWITGNLSGPYALRWYADRSDGAPPAAWVFSLPLWAYRVLMLGWALWLALAVVRYARWAWTCFSTDRLWGPWRLRTAPAG